MITKNKIAFITGASRGLGKNMAIETAKKGLDIVFTYHTNKDAAQETITAIEKLGQKAYAFQLDTREISSFRGIVKTITHFLQGERGSSNIDFLVNNAGTALYASITEVTEEEVDEIFNIHYKGMLFLTKEWLPFINDGGGIINISSGLTRIVIPGSSVYAALKTAVETQTRYLAKELGSRKIRANVIAPGAIATDFGGGRVRDIKEYNDMVAGITALGRVGLPEDIGGVVAFLCTDEAYWINAQRIEISGGQSI